MLRELMDDPSRPMTVFPDPGSDGDPDLPVAVTLDSARTDIAERLHSLYGGDVEITVGEFRYPLGSDAKEPQSRKDKPFPPGTIVVTPVEAIVLPPTGGLTANLRIDNVGEETAHISTAMSAFGLVIDSATNELAGGFTGMMAMPRLDYEARPHDSAVIPVSFDAASYRRRYGYRLPAGKWLGCADFTLRIGPPDRPEIAVRSKPFPIRIA